ncbi:hypothetical protein BJ944DRAFT_165124 [Cunninghamella echinulata]|nr:hypothetical protein BJ944DRAFT_165124 [Cunninghamella echinulata]
MITTISNDEQLEAIYNKLDALTVTYLTKLNQYTLNRNTSSDRLQKGFMDLAHAKYTMGAKTISHYSYDERMKAKLQM